MDSGRSRAILHLGLLLLVVLPAWLAGSPLQALAMAALTVPEKDLPHETRLRRWCRDRPEVTRPRSLVMPLLISVALVAPFIVLQSVYRRAFHEDFPFVLFVFMSIHSLLISLLLTPALRRLLAEKSLGALKLGHWAGLAVSGFLMFVYAGVVVDQLPCFLGVPNCD